MVQKTKYKAKHVFYDITMGTVLASHVINSYRTPGKLNLPPYVYRFDSQHEFLVYLELARMYGQDQIIRQHEIEILPHGYCFPRGKTWRVDFAILGDTSEDFYSHYVEAKGAFLTEFGRLLGTLESWNPNDFDKVRIVFTGSPPKDSRVVSSLLKSPFKKNLLSLKELKTSIKLP